MEYKTRGEYISALEQALAGKDIPDADKMVTDIKNYFFKRNRQSVGDTEIISTLPDPETLAAQYQGKEYGNKRALKKNGSAGFFKRFGIFFVSLFAVISGIFGHVSGRDSFHRARGHLPDEPCGQPASAGDVRPRERAV